MLLPFKDENPLRIIPFQVVTVGLIAACVLTFLWQSTFSEAETARFFLSYGVIPSVLLETKQLHPDLVQLPSALTTLTSMFLHGGWLHLAGNMLFLWVFGDNIEDSMGHSRFLFFYLFCGLVATVTFVVFDPASESPLVGASGAIAGVMGAYLVLHPRVRVLVLVFYRIPLPLPAYIVLAIWFGLQVFNVYVSGDSHVAWWAHIGGFVAGAVLIVPFRYKHIPLFDRGVRH